MKIPAGRRLVTVVALTVVGLVVAVAVTAVLFLQADRKVVALGHEATVRPTLSGNLVVRTGPVIPDVRLDLPGPLGVELQLGKTTASSLNELVQRYAFIASQPDAQIAKIRGVVLGMARAAALRGLVAGVLVPLLWWLPGPARRRALLRSLRRPRPALVVGAALVLVAAAVWQPWRSGPGRPPGEWISLQTYVGHQIDLPPRAGRIEVRAEVTAVQTRRLIRSAVQTYVQSREFYEKAAARAAELDLRQPAEDEGVAVLVSDRHDNIGMDPVARAIGDAAGASVVLDAGDDTSTGSQWEAFSLDSLDEAFEGYEQYAVTGNHDNGPFVGGYLSQLGWTVLHGKVVEGPFSTTILGVGDPRASGLGAWRDETGPLSFGEVAERLADTACSHEGGVDTILVHDADLAEEALQRGCVDLVVAGHTHVHSGPTAVRGADGEIGYTYTTGTTGGAAYAIAIGELRRTAEVSLITYRDGEPVGVQWVQLQTDGTFSVSEWVPLVGEEMRRVQTGPPPGGHEPAPPSGRVGTS